MTPGPISPYLTKQMEPKQVQKTIETAFELNILQTINFMKRMGPRHESSCCSRGPLAHILRNKHSKETSK